MTTALNTDAKARTPRGFGTTEWAQPTTLYHGTSESIARRVLAEGLSPRSVRGQTKGNWSHTVESHPEMVYLTDIYAPYFASHASSEGNERWAILEIDCSLLPETNLYPDEDWVVERLELDSGEHLSSRARRSQTKRLKKKMNRLQCYWADSLEELGNVCYRGTIPTERIRRAAFFNPDSNPVIELAACNPCIQVGNHANCFAKYKLINDWFFGKKPTLDEWMSAVMPSGFPLDEWLKIQRKAVEINGGKWQEQLERLGKELGKRGGLEIVSFAA